MSVKGVILCGGLSSRMGTDKGTRIHNGKSFLMTVLEVLNPVCDDVVISVNESQLSDYKVAFPELNFVVDSGDVKGPLKGMLSVNKAYPKDDLLVVPCDMLNVNKDQLNGILEDESTVYETDEVQPFPGFYKSELLHELSQAKLKKFSLRYIIEEYKINRKPSEAVYAFFNANKPSDL